MRWVTIMISGWGTNVFVVRTVIALNKPSWFCIRDFANFALYLANQLGFFSIYNANLETLVLRALKDFVTVKTEERLGCILARWDLTVRKGHI